MPTTTKRNKKTETATTTNQEQATQPQPEKQEQPQVKSSSDNPSTEKPKRQRKTKAESKQEATAVDESGREVVYAKPESQVGSLSEEQAKMILGWSQPIGEGSFGTNYLFRDMDGVTTRCHNVMSKQRPFDPGLARRWMDEILRGNWKQNFESMVVGRTGLLIEGQHRMVALIWACQEYRKDPSRYPYWYSRKCDPYIDCLIVFGGDEDAETVNTYNTGKPRTLSDAIFAAGLFDLDSTSSEDRKTAKKLSDILSYAIRELWSRTAAGVGLDIHSPSVSHSELLKFFQRHSRLLECVKFILENEDGKYKRISSVLTLGYASALLYLMGCSSTQANNEEGTGYSDIAEPDESLLDWSLWDKATDFWIDVASRNKSMNALIESIGNLLDQGLRCFVKDYDFGESADPIIGVLNEERKALVIKAWNLYVDDKPITEAKLRLEVAVDGEGRVTRQETPTCYGIDVGSADLADYEDEDLE